MGYDLATTASKTLLFVELDSMEQVAGLDADDCFSRRCTAWSAARKVLLESSSNQQMLNPRPYGAGIPW